MGFKSNKKEKDENVKTVSEKVQFDAELAKDKELNRIDLKKFILILTLGYVSFTSYSCYR